VLARCRHTDRLRCDSGCPSPGLFDLQVAERASGSDKSATRDVIVTRMGRAQPVENAASGRLSQDSDRCIVRAMNAPLPDEKELPLREDTRLLGRILGDVLRAQTGDAGFARVEAIRQTAIRFRRTYGEEAQQARGALSSLLNPLAIGEVVYVVRAFSYFSHLVNIAEAVHHIRRRRAYEMAQSPPRPGSIPHALARLSDAGVGGDALQ